MHRPSSFCFGVDVIFPLSTMFTPTLGLFSVIFTLWNPTSLFSVLSFWAVLLIAHTHFLTAVTVCPTVVHWVIFVMVVP